MTAMKYAKYPHRLGMFTLQVAYMLPAYGLDKLRVCASHEERLQC